MRTSHAFLAVASLLAVLSGLTVSTIMEGGSDAHSRAPQFQSPSPEDYTVFPESEGWTNDNRPIVSVTLHRDDYEVDVKSSIFRLDGDSVQPMWDWMNRTLWMRPSTSLEDGSHEVDFSVADVQGSFINTTWTFFVDTSNPVVFITPLPATVPERDITIAGEVEEGNLASLTVNGEPASVDPQGEFEKLVVLWPGMNDINVTAIDYAGNRGTSVSHVAWEPSDGTPVVLEEVSHANSSFSIRLPTDWTIRIDPLLVGGGRADVVALGPYTTGDVQPTISVVSGLAPEVMTSDEMLDWMREAIANFSLREELIVISHPRIVEEAPNALAAQFTILENPGRENETLLFATYVWNGVIARNWVILASGDSELVPDLWPIFAASVDSFSVTVPEPPMDPFEAFRETILVIWPFAVAASIFIVAFFSYVLYLRRKKRE